MAPFPPGGPGSPRGPVARETAGPRYRPAGGARGHRRRRQLRRVARLVARPRGRRGHARRPVRARRPARDLGRRVAAAAQRPRRGRRLHRVGAARARAVARARGGVAARTSPGVRADLVRAPRRRLGGASAPCSPRRASRTSRLSPDDGALLFPSWSPRGLRFLLHEPEAGVVRAQRAVQTLARQAAAHGATVLRGARQPAAAARLEDGRRARGRRRRLGLRRLAPPALPRARAGRAPRPSSSSSTAARPGATRRPRLRRLDARLLRHARPRRARREGRARLRRPAARRRRAAPAGERARRGRRASARRRRFPALAGAPLAGAKTCRYELSIDAHFIAAPHPEHAASGCSAAARATASSTGPRWPSAWPSACAAASRCPPASHSVPARPGGRSAPAGGSR